MVLESGIKSKWQASGAAADAHGLIQKQEAKSKQTGNDGRL